MSVILYTLLIAIVIPYLLSWVSGYCRIKQFGGYDNHNPRAQQSALEGLGARAMSAQANAWEALMMYTATCVIIFIAGIDLTSLDTIAYIFIGFRVLHAIFYLLDVALLRSLSFGVSATCCFYMIYLAANIAT